MAPGAVTPRMLGVLAAATHSAATDAPCWTEGRSDADYLAVLDRLRGHGLDLCAVSAIVLPAAATAGNAGMLKHLVARGADLAVGGRQALVQAAAHAAHETAEWLLEHGVTAPEALDEALVAAVATLDETMVEILLDAGAGIDARDGLALRTACSARPVELYNGEARFVRHRADMLVLLTQRAARLNAPGLVLGLREANGGREVISQILGRTDPGRGCRQAFVDAAGWAFGTALPTDVR